MISLRETTKQFRDFDLFKQIIGRVPKTTALLHFCEHPLDVLNKGFLFGEDMPHRLALTWESHGEPRHHKGPGFNFAFLAEDPDGAGARWDSEFWPAAGNMTHEWSVLFTAPGIAVEHYDGFEQVIFRGEDADLRNAVALRFTETEDEGPLIEAYDKDGNMLDDGLASDTMSDFIEKWAANLQPARKQRTLAR